MEDATDSALAASSVTQAQEGISQALLGYPPTSHTDSPTPSDMPSTSRVLANADSNAAASKPKAVKRKRAAMSTTSKGLDMAVDGDGLMPVVTPKRRQASRKGQAAAAAQEAETTPAEAVAAAVEAVTIADDGKNKVKRQRVKASELAVSTEVELLETPAKGGP